MYTYICIYIHYFFSFLTNSYQTRCMTNTLRTWECTLICWCFANKIGLPKFDLHSSHWNVRRPTLHHLICRPFSNCVLKGALQNSQYILIILLCLRRFIEWMFNYQNPLNITIKCKHVFVKCHRITNCTSVIVHVSICDLPPYVNDVCLVDNDVFGIVNFVNAVLSTVKTNVKFD